jgi:hypothetical protein
MRALSEKAVDEVEPIYQPRAVYGSFAQHRDVCLLVNWERGIVLLTHLRTGKTERTVWRAPGLAQMSHDFAARCMRERGALAG